MKETQTNQQKLAICDFMGAARTGYTVNRYDLESEDETTTTSKQIGHHIIIVDRSGSMYYDIASLKESLIQVLTLDQFLNTGLKVSLISYSGQNDVTMHFSRVSIDDVMEMDSKYIQDIKNIRATYLTCMSQAVEMAKGIIEDDELTAISLHSDGFANDYSVYSEKNEMDRICADLQQQNVFINTIAYSERSDFPFLSQIANKVSGAAVLARSPKEVYNAFLASAEAVSSGGAVTVDIPIGDADFQVFVDEVSGRVIGSESDLTVKGVDPSNPNDCYVLRYSVSDVSAPTDGISDEARNAAFVLSRALLASGDINGAKYALNSSLNATVISDHARALTSIQLGEMGADLDEVIFGGSRSSDIIAKTAQFGEDGISIIELCGLLSEWRGDILINRKALSANYNRRGLRRLRGKREEDGTLTEPWLDTEYLDSESEFVRMGTLNVNTNTATVNMNIARPIRLVEKESSKPVAEVAGVMLDNLCDFKNYTIVGDGEVNVPELEVRFSSKQAFDAFSDSGVITGNAKYNHATVYTIDLTSMSVCPYEIEVDDIGDAFLKLAGLKLVTGIISAHIKEESVTYTKDQLDELKRHYLSPALYVNFPTTNEYLNLEDALRDGSVDTRVSYRIDIGNTDILHVSKLISANAFLKRMYEAVSVETDKVVDDGKPNMSMNLDSDIKWAHKKLSARTKITPVDNFMKPIVDAFLGLGPIDALSDILVPLGLVDLLEAIRNGTKGEELVAELSKAKEVLEGAQDALWRTAVCPLVFYVGSTGLVPDELGFELTTVDDLKKKYPELKFAKKELDGSFFVADDVIMSVYATNEHYSTTR